MNPLPAHPKTIRYVDEQVGERLTHLDKVDGKASRKRNVPFLEVLLTLFRRQQLCCSSYVRPYISAHLQVSRLPLYLPTSLLTPKNMYTHVFVCTYMALDRHFKHP